MKQKLLLGLTVLLITGCGCAGNALKANYEKMKYSKDGINGYEMDLRITDKIGEINDILRITNYHDKTYEINLITVTAEDRTATTTYVQGDNIYELDETTGEMKEDTSNIKYTNPKIYLEGLVNLSSIGKGTAETLGEKEYTVYSVKFKKKIVNDILKDTNLDITITKDVPGKVYIDKDDYVYRIKYELDDATITVTYIKIDDIREIRFPGKIEE